MENRKIVVIFPGGNYSVDCPLLYYAGFKYETLGYEKVLIKYENSFNKDDNFDIAMQKYKEFALNQLETIRFSDFEDIVFVLKSIGTVIAGWIEEILSINVRHIYLTPIKETLLYITKNKNIIAVISGTKDKVLDADILFKHCNDEGVFLRQIEGAGHRLEIWGNVNKNIDILKEVVQLY